MAALPQLGLIRPQDYTIAQGKILHKTASSAPFIGFVNSKILAQQFIQSHSPDKKSVVIENKKDFSIAFILCTLLVYTIVVSLFAVFIGAGVAINIATFSVLPFILIGVKIIINNAENNNKQVERIRDELLSTPKDVLLGS